MWMRPAVIGAGGSAETSAGMDMDMCGERPAVTGKLMCPLLSSPVQIYLAQPTPPSTERPWRDPRLTGEGVGDSTAAWAAKSAGKLHGPPNPPVGRSSCISKAVHKGIHFCDLSHPVGGFAPTLVAALLWAPLQAIGAASATEPPASTTAVGGLLLLPPRAGPSPLADLALHLLLLLVYCPDDPPATHNPFRR